MLTSLFDESCVGLQGRRFPGLVEVESMLEEIAHAVKSRTPGIKLIPGFLEPYTPSPIAFRPRLDGSECEHQNIACGPWKEPCQRGYQLLQRSHAGVPRHGWGHNHLSLAGNDRLTHDCVRPGRRQARIRTQQQVHEESTYIGMNEGNGVEGEGKRNGTEGKGREGKTREGTEWERMEGNGGKMEWNGMEEKGRKEKGRAGWVRELRGGRGKWKSNGMEMNGCINEWMSGFMDAWMDA